MDFKIKKESNGNGYSAICYDEAGKLLWKTNNPISKNGLSKKLYDLGFHQVDIVDAMLAIDNSIKRKFYKDINGYITKKRMKKSIKNISKSDNPNLKKLSELLKS